MGTDVLMTQEVPYRIYKFDRIESFQSNSTVYVSLGALFFSPLFLVSLCCCSFRFLSFFSLVDRIARRVASQLSRAWDNKQQERKTRNKKREGRRGRKEGEKKGGGEEWHAERDGTIQSMTGTQRNHRSKELSSKLIKVQRLLLVYSCIIQRIISPSFHFFNSLTFFSLFLLFFRFEIGCFFGRNPVSPLLERRSRPRLNSTDRLQLAGKPTLHTTNNR